jgi:hypothetical protein
MKFDAHYASSPRPVTTEAKPRLNAEVIKQLSSGSLSGRLSLSSRKGLMLRYLHNVPGFALGLVMSLFSKVLVLFIGLGITASQVGTPFVFTACVNLLVSTLWTNNCSLHLDSLESTFWTSST